MRAGRIRLFEMVVGVFVVLASMAAVGVAVYQGRVMERTLEASVWPYLEYGTGNFDPDDDAWRIRFIFTNQGVGPARIRWMRLFDSTGEPVRDPAHFLADCCAPAEITDPDARLAHIRGVFASGSMVLFNEAVHGRVLAPGDEVVMFAIERPEDEAARAVWEALDTARYDIRPEVCYCSVFDECWRARLPAIDHAPVRECALPDISSSGD